MTSEEEQKKISEKEDHFTMNYLLDMNTLSLFFKLDDFDKSDIFHT